MNSKSIGAYLESLPDQTVRRYAMYYVIALGFVSATLFLATGGSLVVALSIVPLNILMYKAYYFTFDYFNGKTELDILRAEGL